MLEAKKLTQAIYLVMTGAALSLTPLTNAHASTTMYNLYGASNTPVAPKQETDGYVWGFDTPSSGDPNAATPGWVGTSGPTTTPFLTKGGMALNWAAHITNAGDSLTISQQDAYNRYGIYADIDTSAGAWRDPSALNGAGTRHSIDIGLFKSDLAQTINLTITGISNPAGNYGMTIYQGAPQNPDYNHYGYPVFNSAADLPGYSETITNTTNTQTTTDPFGVQTTTTSTTISTVYSHPYVTRTLVDPDTGLTSNTLSFQAEANMIYTLMLGGNNGEMYDDYAGYELNISSAPLPTSAVPLPSSVWLFITAISGLLGVKRRKKVLC